MVNCGGNFCTMTDFGGTGVIPFFSAIVTAIPPFFSIVLFMFWLFGAGSSYFIILKTTGKKRFWHSLTAMSFISFLLSLLMAGMNGLNDITFLSGYWIGFYILMTGGSYILLERYK